ncbi:hypothetical protein TRIUR3_17270 [Triticum urartu]|uniref:Uncharacterized protein n=1 Tax=Triticum urartu TaxID=4572 RepID=M7ZGS2_TRIUA|nr:hypothetical protein TRIUR3_17270 [Triticum urartu]
MDDSAALSCHGANPRPFRLYSSGCVLEIATDTCVYKRVLRKSADEPKDTLKDAAADASLPRTRSVKCYNCGYPEAAYFQLLLRVTSTICTGPDEGRAWPDAVLHLLQPYLWPQMLV